MKTSLIIYQQVSIYFFIFLFIYSYFYFYFIVLRENFDRGIKNNFICKAKKCNFQNKNYKEIMNHEEKCKFLFFDNLCNEFSNFIQKEVFQSLLFTIPQINENKRRIQNLENKYFIQKK